MAKKSKISPDSTFELVTPNPKREGSKVYYRYAAYKVGGTVQEALDKGATMADIRKDIGLKLIKIKAPEKAAEKTGDKELQPA